jgi:pimeloyl-ACP methyl ester carboxylesterase
MAQYDKTSRRSLALLACAALPAACQSPAGNMEARKPHGYIWYLDGAGGGGKVFNWAGGVRTGLLNAGYTGGGEIFGWNTGLGVGADQVVDDSYKRGKARELAAEIQEYRRQYPDAPTALIGLSAGTAVAVFTLEELPVSCPVDNVVLLGASVSADHDLTQALQRIRNQMYVFTSEKDAVLRFLVPISGTADRTVSPSAGLNGFQIPSGASPQTRELYRKVSDVPWEPAFARKGDYGGHTDTVKASFVQAYIAPLLMTGPAASVATSGTGLVSNPDYLRWKNFRVGSWVRMDGQATRDGQTHPIRVTERLAELQSDQLVIERLYESPDGQHEKRQYYVDAHIDPAEHPLTHQGAHVTDLPQEKILIAGQNLSCEVKTVESSGDYSEWGRNPSGKIYLSSTIPGGLAKIQLKASSDSGPFEFNGQVTEYKPMK